MSLTLWSGTIYGNGSALAIEVTLVSDARAWESL